MNWTGGTLQRTKNADKGVIQKQKAYFARARTQLQQSPGTPAAPFRPEFFQDGDDRELDHHLPLLGSGSVRHTGHLARKRPEVDERYTPSSARRSRCEDDQRKSQDISIHFSKGEIGSEVQGK